jgi:hypothetical protein
LFILVVIFVTLLVFCNIERSKKSYTGFSRLALKRGFTGWAKNYKLWEIFDDQTLSGDILTVPPHKFALPHVTVIDGGKLKIMGLA